MLKFGWLLWSDGIVPLISVHKKLFRNFNCLPFNPNLTHEPDPRTNLTSTQAVSVFIYAGPLTCRVPSPDPTDNHHCVYVQIKKLKAIDQEAFDHDSFGTIPCGQTFWRRVRNLCPVFLNIFHAHSPTPNFWVSVCLVAWLPCLARHTCGNTWFQMEPIHPVSLWQSEIMGMGAAWYSDVLKDIKFYDSSKHEKMLGLK